MRQGLRAGVTTVLALGTGLLTNLVTADWAWPVLAALVAFGAAWVALELFWHPDAPPPDGSPAPRQLPAGTPDLVGRSAELARLDRITARATVCTIVGTAGVGKTTLAVHWARRASDRFPGGQVYVNLRGFESASAPLTPAEALNGVLASLGVAPDRLPTDSTRAPRCCAASPRSGGCSCSSTTPATRHRSGRCCPGPAAASPW